ncbi:MAG TPA: copper resistance CopC family protein, partial [Herpetosiphonaceae bacterium]|nr:copper resistance CopC family protein [Herpetosiphonaceae bacterium]
MNAPGRLAIIATLLVLLLLPATVQAHAELMRAEPAEGAVLNTSPARVRLYFSEPIESDFFALEVYAADGRRVDLRDAHIPPDDVAGLEAGLPPLDPGGYSVAWRILSIDGHVVRGTYSFSVGTATTGAFVLPGVQQQRGAPAGLGPAVRGMTYLLAFALVGGFGFAPLILWPALRIAVADTNLPARRATRGLLWIVWPAVVLAFILSLLALLLQASDVTGVPLGEVLSGHAISRLLTGTRYGTWWAARFALLAGLLAIIAVASVET